MWICFSDSFLSIVEPAEKDGTLLVRARRDGDIERVFAGAKVEKTLVATTCSAPACRASRSAR